MLLLLPLAAAAQRLPETPADAAKAHLVLLDDLLGVKLAEAPAESAVVPSPLRIGRVPRPLMFTVAAPVLAAGAR